jgi:hypothetical protein
MLKKTTISLALSIFASAMISDMLAFFLTMTGLLIKFNGILVVLLFVNIIILGMLIYTKSWDEGFRDPNRVKYGRIDKFLYKGFVAGLLADIPFILVYILLIICSLTKWNEEIMLLVMYGFNMQFFSIIINLQHVPVALAVILLPLPLISGVSYILGYYQITISSKIIYKKSK